MDSLSPKKLLAIVITHDNIVVVLDQQVEADLRQGSGHYAHLTD
jgi:hypothetical protein